MPDTNDQSKRRDLRPGDDYLTKLNTLLPAEITGLYLFIRALAANNRSLDIPLAIAVVVIAILFYAVAPRMLRITNRVARVLYSLTFLLWVASIEMTTITFRLKSGLQWNPEVVGFAIGASVAIWTFSLPFIFDALGQRMPSQQNDPAQSEAPQPQLQQP